MNVGALVVRFMCKVWREGLHCTELPAGPLHVFVPPTVPPHLGHHMDVVHHLPLAAVRVTQVPEVTPGIKPDRMMRMQRRT